MLTSNQAKIVFIDLDGTLIKTHTRNTFPQGVWDMELRYTVFEQLRKLHPAAILIVSNQGGIEAGHVDGNLFQYKFLYVIAALQEYIGNYTYIAGHFCHTNDPENEFRKPNIGMCKALYSEVCTRIGVAQDHFTSEEMLFIGDRETDEQTAKNFGVPYMDVNDFLKEDVQESPFKVLNTQMKVYLMDSHGEPHVYSEGEAIAKAKELNGKFAKKQNGELPLYVAVPYNWIFKDDDADLQAEQDTEVSDKEPDAQK